MTSKEALELLGAEKLARGELIRNDSKVEPYIECINKDLERLEALEKENKKWREIVGCDLCEALGREILLEEIEKLKKVIKIIKRMDIFLNQDEDFKDGSIEICGYLEVSEKVLELLKEVLGE